MQKVYKKYDGTPITTIRDPFLLSEDLQKLKLDFEEVGFTNIKMWYQACNFPIFSGEEYL